MIESIADLGLDEADKVEDIEKKLQEKLGITVKEMQEHLSSYVKEHAEELTHEFVNIAPMGKYDELLEDNDSMAEFLKTEAHKPEHWLLYSIRQNETNQTLISFDFKNAAVDEGESMEGFVFVSKSGKIRHAFAQGES
jgi:hypothetical protein